MRRIHIKRRKSGLFSLTLLVLSICIVVSYNKVTLQSKAQIKQEEYQKLEQEKKKLESKQKKLKEENELSKEDIESIARDKLGMVYKNEIVFEPN